MKIETLAKNSEDRRGTSPNSRNGFQKGHPLYKGSEKSWFKKGHIPWSSGRKGLTLNTGRTHFKKGQISPRKGKFTSSLTPILKRIRFIKEYKIWKEGILKRDEGACQGCQSCKEKLNVHHKESIYMILERNKIKTMDDAIKCKELWKLENGITLCNRCHHEIERISRKIILSLIRKHKVITIGNGGSASQAIHFTGELLGKFKYNRAPLAAIAPFDIATITAIANDMEYKYIFSRQIEALGIPGDVLLTISTSGTSLNIIEAIKIAENKGMIVLALPNKKKDKWMRQMEIDNIQEIHLCWLHLIAELVEAHFVARPIKEAFV